MIIILLDFTKLIEVVFDELELLDDNTRLLIKRIEISYSTKRYDELMQALAVIVERIIKSKIFPDCYNSKYLVKRCIQYMKKNYKNVPEQYIVLLLDQLYNTIYTRRNKISHGEYININHENALESIVMTTVVLKQILFLKNIQKLLSTIRVHPIIENNTSRFLIDLYTCIGYRNYDNNSIIIDEQNKKQLYDCLKHYGYTSWEISRYLRGKLKKLGITKIDNRKTVIKTELLIHFLYNLNTN